MKILQLNCWGGKLSTAIKRVIEREQPDIVCLQEATDITKRPGSVIDPFTDFLPPETYPYTLFAPAFSMRYMHEIINLGNAIASKHSPDNSHVEFTSGAFKGDIDSLNGDYNIRNFVHAEYTLGKQSLHVLTHHGHHEPDNKDGSQENTRQIAQLADYIRTLDGSVILSGDLNLHPQSSSLQPLNKILVNLPVKFNVSSTRTQFAKRQEVIDYIFVSDDVNVQRFRVLDDLISDHAALVVEFDLP